MLEAWEEHARAWVATKTGPLLTRDALLSRILHTGQPVRDTRRTHELDRRMQNKVIYWYAAANHFPVHHIKHAHFLRLLEKFAEFREDQARVNAAKEQPAGRQAARAIRRDEATCQAPARRGRR